MNKNVVIAFIVCFTLTVTILTISCRKEKKSSHEPPKIANTKTGSPSGARLHGDYSKVSYDASLGMLVFKDVSALQETIDKLYDELANFQYDNGKTNELIKQLANRKSDSHER